LGKLTQVVKMDLIKSRKDVDRENRDIPISGEIERSESFLGKTVKVKGNISSSDSIHIEGKINGNVEADHKIIIGAQGSVNGKMEAEVVDLYGTAKGEIITKKIMNIHNSAKFEGNINSNKVTIEEGGIFNGNMNMPEKKGK
jgi:cytoskeletal protein CcmA (bactofilin family)